MQTRAPAEPTVREFEADVVDVDGRTVTLDHTYFYAESGGQPADRGTIDGRRVVDVQADGAGVRHTLETEPEFGDGDTVVGVVDDDFRTYCMRAHTASHVLYGAGRRLLDDLGYGGFDISGSKVRVDFTTSTDIDDETLVELERLVNRTVWDSRAVTWQDVPVEETTARDDVAFNTKTEEGVMDDADTVRIVDIDGWDVAACGGTHVSNTREIGPVTVLDRSNPGEGLTRVEFAVGPTGIDRTADRHLSLRETAAALETGIEDLAETATRVRSDRDDLRERVRELERAAVEDALDGFDRITKDGTPWRLGVLDGIDPNDAGEAAKDAVGDDEVVVAVGGSAAPYVVVAAGSESDVHAGSVVDAVTEAFGGGGGGGPPFAQGGGLDADPGEVLDELTELEPSS
ncbi:alanine--tRNA ligase-related protein [Halobellus captivus]|uniref:alanine--tRNA ligase-related protein n=1 Tax=Halobellus captivus TaxID=2592614 RepID=UPI0011A9D0D3|nr:DHHA1 domain-containing protein [Halobellus captivus]